MPNPEVPSSIDHKGSFPGVAIPGSITHAYNLIRRFSSRKAVETTDPSSPTGTAIQGTGAKDFAQQQASVFVTDELERAIESCQAKVSRIAQDCRRRNHRFRDIEFDLEGDRVRCLYSLDGEEGDDDSLAPKDVRRVSDIFREPTFFAHEDRPGRRTIQGGLGNCWFLSALATVSAVPGLIEKICVARDEAVGVYGFIFYMDGGWVDVVVDDLLYSKVPRYEELSTVERALYQEDQDLYDELGRKGSKTLYFSSSGSENETWVSILEKAYAKLHGDYAALSGGQSTDALEDLTGGVSSVCHMADILDPDRFWTEELCMVGKERLFGCFIYGMNPSEFGERVRLVNGLVMGHAYSVIAAVEVAGRRFVKLRNPWGRTEWSGRWSDGSQEWTAEWLARLPELNHSFGNDGEFLMEYKDFLRTWTVIGRTILFDDTWVLSSQWLNVATRPYPSPWSFGDASYTVTVAETTPAILVLGRVNTRAWRELDAPYSWSFDLAIFARGASHPICTASQDMLWQRTVTAELTLEPGEYVVHVRLDRATNGRAAKNQEALSEGKWSGRKLARKQASRAMSASLATNFDPARFQSTLPLPPSLFTGRDLTEIEIATKTSAETSRSSAIAASSVTEALEIPLNPSMTVSDEPLSLGSDATELPTKEDGEAAEAQHDQPPPSPSAASDSSFKTATGPESGSNAAPNCEAPRNSPSLTIAVNGLEPTTSVSESQETAMESGAVDGVHVSLPRASGPSPITENKPPLPVHDGITCDICKMYPIVGARYHCFDSECSDFDLCSECVDKGVHPASHRLLRMSVPEHLNDANMDASADDEVTLGLRVYTKKNAPATVRGQLRHGTVLRWTKSTNA